MAYNYDYDKKIKGQIDHFKRLIDNARYLNKEMPLNKLSEPLKCTPSNVSRKMNAGDFNIPELVALAEFLGFSLKIEFIEQGSSPKTQLELANDFLSQGKEKKYE